MSTRSSRWLSLVRGPAAARCGAFLLLLLVGPAVSAQKEAVRAPDDAFRLEDHIVADLRPVLKGKRLEEGLNLLYTSPQGFRFYVDAVKTAREEGSARSTSERVVGFLAKDRDGRALKTTSHRSAAPRGGCGVCIYYEGKWYCLKVACTFVSETRPGS